MSSLTVTIPVRNKDLDIIKGTFDTIEIARNRTPEEPIDDDLSIIVADGGSDDDYSHELMREAYQHGFGYEKYKIDEWNKPKILNRVLETAVTDWFACLDADYVLEPHFFNKNIKSMESGRFVQCRGWDRDGDVIEDPAQFAVKRLAKNDNYEEIEEMGYELRPEADYGGFQAFPVDVGQRIGGYDERFKWYGGMHHEMRERLSNYGLTEVRCGGDPVMLHQPHPNWQDSKDGERLKAIKKERAKHRTIIRELKHSDRVEAVKGIEQPT